MVGKSILQEIATLVIIREIPDSNLETGRYGPKSGVSKIIQESWKHWHTRDVKRVSISGAGRLQEQFLVWELT